MTRTWTFAILLALALTTPAHAADSSRLPLGDGKRSSAPRVGYVYSCQRFEAGGPGAGVDGPWIDQSAGTWNLDAKAAVGGSVGWPDRFATTLSSTRRRLAGNGLPSHPTGIFPVRSSDPAYRYDRNPTRSAATRWAPRCPATRAGRPGPRAWAARSAS